MKGWIGIVLFLKILDQCLEKHDTFADSSFAIGVRITIDTPS